MVEVDRGRRAYASEAWLEAYEQLSAADRSEPLCARDVWLLATSAYMIGRESEYLDPLALAAHEQGHVLIRLGRGKERLRLLDENRETRHGS